MKIKNINEYMRFVYALQFYHIIIFNSQRELEGFFLKGSFVEFVEYSRRINILDYTILDDCKEIHFKVDMGNDRGNG